MVNQNSLFFATLTNVGLAKQANADALGVPWKLAQMGVGDANDTDPIPDIKQTKLINEWRRAPLNQVKVDPSNAAIIIAEQVIPADVGGKWVREIGLYDVDGDLVAVANCAPTFKPLLAQGSGRTQVIRINLQVSNTSNVELKIDPSVVLATRTYVDDKFSKVIEVYAQANPYDGTAGKLAKVGYMGWGSSYASGPKYAASLNDDQALLSGLYRYDAASVGKAGFGSGNGGVLHESLIAVGGNNWGTQLAIDYNIDAIGFRRRSGAQGWQPWVEIWHKNNLQPATQEQANAGTDDSFFITAKKLTGAIVALIIQATETVRGIAKIATQALVDAGADASTIVTPKTLEGRTQSNAYDATTGKLQKVGSFGWGSSYTNGPQLVTSLNNAQVTYSGLYRFNGDTVGKPDFGGGFGSALQSSLSDAGGNWGTQLAIDYTTDTIGFRRLSNTTWQPWIEIWHKGNLPKATQTQANTGTDDTAFITSKTLTGTISALVIQATEAIRGTAKVAAQTDLTDGTDDTKFVTAKKLVTWFATKVATYTVAGIAAFATAAEVVTGTSETKMVNPAVLRSGFTILKAANGYIVFPVWLGGFVIQWGTSTIAAATTSVAYTLTFPTSAAVTVSTSRNLTAGLDGVELSPVDRAGFSAVIVSASGSATQTAGTFGWISLGW